MKVLAKVWLNSFTNLNLLWEGGRDGWNSEKVGRSGLMQKILRKICYVCNGASVSCLLAFDMRSISRAFWGRLVGERFSRKFSDFFAKIVLHDFFSDFRVPVLGTGML